MKKNWKSAVAVAIAAGLSLAACGGSGSSSSSDTSSTKRVKNAALTVAPTTTIDPWSKSCANGGGCRIGDTGPGGGIVFYASKTNINKVDGVSDGGAYLEFLPTTLSNQNWGCKNTVVASTTIDPVTGESLQKSVGMGAANSKAIVDICPTGTAAGIALDRTDNGFSDWFLPSQGELNQVCFTVRKLVAETSEICPKNVMQVIKSVGGIELKSFHWLSSSEARYDRAWTWDFTSYKKDDGTYTMDTGSYQKHNCWCLLGLARAFGSYAGTPPVTTTTIPLTCAQGGACKVGDTGPGGGKIFYTGTTVINSYGDKYKGGKSLEYLDPYPTTTFKFRCVMHVNGTESGIGAGAKNTALYQDACKETGFVIDRATKATNGGKSDWFIPSLDELNELCAYVHKGSKLSSGQCNGKNASDGAKSSNVAQWSSTQYSKNSMWGISFGDGTSIKRDKGDYSYNFYLVRATG